MLNANQYLNSGIFYLTWVRYKYAIKVLFINKSTICPFAPTAIEIYMESSKMDSRFHRKDNLIYELLCYCL